MKWIFLKQKNRLKNSTNRYFGNSEFVECEIHQSKKIVKPSTYYSMSKCVLLLLKLPKIIYCFHQ